MKMFLAFADQPLADSAHRKVVHIPPRIVSKRALFEAFDARLGLPDYFGSNWDAFHEVMRTLDWLPDLNIEITHADIPLVGDQRQAMIYLDILNGAVEQSMTLSAGPALHVTFPSECREQIERLLDACGRSQRSLD